MSPRGTLRDCGLTLFFFPFNHPLRSEERDGLSLGVLPSLAQQQEETGGFPPCPAARAGGAGQGEDQVCCEPGIWGFAQPGSYFLCVHSWPRCPACCRDGVGRELWSCVPATPARQAARASQKFGFVFLQSFRVRGLRSSSASKPRFPLLIRPQACSAPANCWDAFWAS